MVVVAVAWGACDADTGQPVDPALVGTWETAGGGANNPWRTVWRVDADGTYVLTGALNDRGRITAGGGRWTTLSDVTNLPGAGTYEVLGPQAIATVGPLGAAAWKRSAGGSEPVRQAPDTPRSPTSNHDARLPNEAESVVALRNQLTTVDGQSEVSVADKRQLVESILALEPNDVDTLEKRASLVARQDGPEAGFQEYARIVQRFPDTGGKLGQSIYDGLAENALLTQRFEVALTAAQRATDLSTVKKGGLGPVAVSSHLALALLMNGDVQGARKIYDRFRGPFDAPVCVFDLIGQQSKAGPDPRITTALSWFGVRCDTPNHCEVVDDGTISDGGSPIAADNPSDRSKQDLDQAMEAELACLSIAGEWRWSDGRVVELDEAYNAFLRASSTSDPLARGKWQCGAEGRYVINWSSGSVDTLALSADMKSLSGTTDRGSSVSATRLQ